MKESTTPFEVFLLDPDIEQRTHIAELLHHVPGVILSATCASGEEGLSALAGNLPDVIILETDLGDMTGFEFIRQMHPVIKPLIVLVSNKPELAVEAFEYFVSDFIPKPVSRERLQLTIIRLKEQLLHRGNRHLQEQLNALFRYINPSSSATREPSANGHLKLLPVKMSGKIYLLDPAEIEYIEAAGYYIEVFSRGRKHLIRKSLTQLDSALDGHQFIRIHRSVIVNVRYMKEIIREGANEFSVRMGNDKLFRISRSYKPEVFSKIGV